MNWHDLCFLHWPIAKDVIRPLVPAELELETYDGTCWIGIVPFYMTGVRPRLLPAMDWYSDFLELNVRTYVQCEGKPGVWFFSLDAESLLAVKVARYAFALPYFHATMSLHHCDGDVLQYASRRKTSGAHSAEFDGSYQPTGNVFEAGRNSIEHWLTARYCLYAVNQEKRITRVDINHNQWRLQKAEVEIHKNTMLEPLNVPVQNSKPLVHFSKFLNVVSWSPEFVATQPIAQVDTTSRR